MLTTVSRAATVFVALSLAVIVTASGCSASSTVDEPALTADAAQAAAPTPPPTATSAPTATPLPTPTPQPPSPAEVFESLGNSIVYIQTTDLSSGTGIVIEGGWILTNAHVVDRFKQVRIGRSDGVDLGEYPVHAIDWVFDLAVVGPVDDPALTAFERATSADLAIGDPVMLVGFPDESEQYPTPTLTLGIVSRTRRVALGDYPFIQVDATIAPGQSGGALIDEEGRLVGISGLEYGRGEFGLAFAADPMWPRIDDLLEGPSNILPDTEPVLSFTEEVGPIRHFGFVLEVEDHGRVQVRAVADADVFIDLASLGGETITDNTELGDPFDISNRIQGEGYFVDEELIGAEELTGEVFAGTYQVVVGAFSESPSTVIIDSSNPIRPFHDVEEGAELPIGELVEGDIDWRRDSDRWTLDLLEGEHVTITADGIADTVLAVRLDGEMVVWSDDETLGMFGTGSRVIFEAPADGTYEVEIGTYDETRWGYLVLVEVEEAG